MPIPRRSLLFAPALLLGKASLSSRERVDRALKGAEADRPALSLWHHFGIEKKFPPAEAARKHAEATLDFHRRANTDLIKVMSDFPYPKTAQGNWWDLKVSSNPFPAQIDALAAIRKTADTYFVETIFNPWNVAEKLSSKQEVAKMMTESPKQLLSALEVIAQSEANHARRAIETGAAGIFLAIANADSTVMTREQYRQFSEPFDRLILNSVNTARLNVLHIHGAKVYLDFFNDRWPAAVLNYSSVATGIPISAARKQFSRVVMGGIDENNYPKLELKQLKSQYESARSQAGAGFILAPGCSVPNETPVAELNKLARLFA